MSIKSKVNAARAAAMRSLTRNIGTSPSAQITTPLDRSQVRRVLICRPNHRLGNQLLMTPLLQEITTLFPQAQIDLLVKGNLGPVLFKEYDAVDRIIQLPRKPFKSLGSYLAGWLKIRQRRYDLAINVVHGSSSGRISTKFANARHKFFGDVPDNVSRVYADHEHMAKYPVYSLRENLKAMGIDVSATPAAPLDLKLTPAELVQGKALLNDIVPGSKIICLFTFATGTKRYDIDFWKDFYERIQKAYPHYVIFEMLPVENVSQLSFGIPHFYSTDIRQIASVLANCSVFIGADSGMMHLASAAGVPTIGLFKVTNMKGYEPYGRASTGINTTSTSPNEWISALARALHTETVTENIVS